MPILGTYISFLVIVQVYLYTVFLSVRNHKRQVLPWKYFYNSYHFLWKFDLANEIFFLEMEEFNCESRHEEFVYVLNSKVLNQLEYYSYLPKSNNQDLKETIRFISEELVWSDQNKSRFFE